MGSRILRTTVSTKFTRRTARGLPPILFSIRARGDGDLASGWRSKRKGLSVRFLSWNDQGTRLNFDCCLWISPFAGLDLGDGLSKNRFGTASRRDSDRFAYGLSKDWIVPCQFTNRLDLSASKRSAPKIGVSRTLKSD